MNLLTAKGLGLSLVGLCLAATNGMAANLTVTDSLGQPLAAEVEVLSDHYSARVEKRQDHHEITHSAADVRPFLIEITKGGYKPRVLVHGADFAENDTIRVTLEEGPFRKGESVFQTVTKRPPTELGVSEMPLSSKVRVRERDYRYIAAEGREPDYPLPPRSGEPGFSTGHPRVNAAAPRESLRVLYDRSLEGAASLPKIRVIDGRGKPVREICVRLTLGQDRVGPTELPPRTLRNEEGLYSVPRNCLVSSGNSRPTFVSGGDSEVPETVLLKGKAEKVRDIRQEGKKANGVAAAALIQAWKPLASSTKPPSQNEIDLLDQCRAARIRRAVPFLKKRLQGVSTVDEWNRSPEYSDALATCIAEIEGKRSAHFFETLANREDCSRELRRACLVGLGKIGSRRSVAAFVRIRDRLAKLEGAPEVNKDCTHAQKMSEAVIFTCNLGDNHAGSTWLLYPFPESASVSFDYESGEIHCNASCGPLCFCTVKLKRFGDEWLVVEVGRILCV